VFGGLQPAGRRRPGGWGRGCGLVRRRGSWLWRGSSPERRPHRARPRGARARQHDDVARVDEVWVRPVPWVLLEDRAGRDAVPLGDPPERVTGSDDVGSLLADAPLERRGGRVVLDARVAAAVEAVGRRCGRAVGPAGASDGGGSGRTSAGGGARSGPGSGGRAAGAAARGRTEVRGTPMPGVSALGGIGALTARLRRGPRRLSAARAAAASTGRRSTRARR
jgi:hypothetical protein